MKTNWITLCVATLLAGCASAHLHETTVIGRVVEAEEFGAIIAVQGNDVPESWRRLVIEPIDRPEAHLEALTGDWSCPNADTQGELYALTLQRTQIYDGRVARAAMLVVSCAPTLGAAAQPLPDRGAFR